MRGLKMPCHLCCRRKVDVAKIEKWLLCVECRKSETLDEVLSYLRKGDGAAAERVARRKRTELSTVSTFYT